MKYISLTEEPFAIDLPPEAGVYSSTLPPSLDPAPPDSIPWSTLNLSTTLLIDARSPSEFALDHIEGAVNVPILSDFERAEVGKAFASGTPVF